ncbi:MAG: family 16 glycosylhydrolase [Mariniphaga sp.]|nr:family 16 glycosylhydrolase [Mariniphaga sp.]
MKRILKIKIFISSFFLIFLFGNCEKTETGLTADFTFSFTDENHVEFVNNSDGNYNSMQWDFGNGETAATLDKNETFTIYYPQAGEYNVLLTITNGDGESRKAIKSVSISKDDIVLAFTAEPDPSNSNKINLENKTVGEYDSFKWLYRHKIIENNTKAVAYFPFSGTFSVELEVTKGTSVFSKIETIVISKDDPDYISNLTLTWADEFDETEVNTDNWTFETGAGGWGNNELENYTNGENSEIIDGKLVITAKKVNESKSPGSYTSSRMVSLDKHDFLYGRMEIRVKLPSGKGIWPAIWMLGSNINTVSWPACGEIDILEYVGYQPNIVHATVHTPSGYGSNGNGASKSLATCEEEFHNYGLIWTEKNIKFYIDNTDNITYTYEPASKTDETWPFNKPHFFILNVAVGGNWGGAQGIDNSIFPQKMEVDYVRVYQEVD